MNSMSDQISNLSEEDQQRFHAYTQKRLRRRRAEAKNRTEKENDNVSTRSNRSNNAP